MDLYYLHGLFSSCNSRKARAFRKMGFKCIGWKADELNTYEIMEKIKSIKKSDVVAGSSMGGYLALCSKASKLILLNPAISLKGLNKFGNFRRFLAKEKGRVLNFNRTIYTFIGSRDRIVKHDITFLSSISKALVVLDDDHRFVKRFSEVKRWVRFLLSSFKR